VPRLNRDRTTLLIYAQLAVWGYFLYGFGPAVPLLRDEQGVSAALAGLHGTGLAVGIVFGGLLFTYLARRIGRGPTIWVGMGGVVFVVGLLWVARPLPLTIAAAVIASTCGSLIVNGVNVALSDYHGPAAPAAISEANAAAAFTGLLAPLVVGGSVALGLGWRPALTVVIALVAAVALVAYGLRIRVPRRPPAGAPVPAADRPRLPLPYWIAWTLMAACASIEVCLSLWAVDVLRTHAGLSSGAAAAAISGILVGMFLGRLVGGRFALRVPPVRLLLIALGVSFLGFALFWTSTAGWLAVAGLFIAGLGNSVHYPLAISMALGAARGQEDRAAGFSSYAIAVGFGVAPFALGWISDQVGPHRAFLILPGFIFAAVALTVWLGRATRAAAAVVAVPVSADGRA
jgi:predicted MFS family arabinose efflux permease